MSRLVLRSSFSSVWPDVNYLIDEISASNLSERIMYSSVQPDIIAVSWSGPVGAKCIRSKSRSMESPLVSFSIAMDRSIPISAGLNPAQHDSSDPSMSVFVRSSKSTRALLASLLRFANGHIFLENDRVDAPAVASLNSTRDVIAGCISRLVRGWRFQVCSLIAI
jgi:hypothetical protein